MPASAHTTKDGRTTTTVGLHSNSANFEMPVMIVQAKRALLLFKAVLCFAVSALFIFYWRQFGVFSGTMPWYRMLVPIGLPVIGIAFGLHFVFSSGKRLILLENGVRYHTPLFELESLYSEIKAVRLDLGQGQNFSAGSYGFSMYRRTTPVQTLFLSLSDGRVWGFRSSFFSNLTEAEAEIKKHLTAI